MATLTLDGVGLTYPGGAAGVRDLTVQVDDGEVVALLGPSGSGKTTALRLVAGFLRPDTGSIRIGSDVVAGPGAWTAPERRRLGMVFQQHAIWPHWDVARNVDYPLRRAGVRRAERAARVAELLDVVGLSGYAERRPDTLSGGQRQRVALARALAVDPQVLLLDEALSALDEPLRAELRTELRRLAQERRQTILHVTHDRDEALALADRIVVLRDGQVAQFGTPAQIVHEPNSAFVAAFMGDAALLPVLVTGGTVRTAEGSVPIRHLDGRLSDGPAQLALLPDNVTVRPDPDGDGVVSATLFARTGSSAVVAWRGISLSVRMRGAAPSEGSRVSVSVERGVLFPVE